MADSVRSSGIVKKKSSSGCLIIKKKDGGRAGVGGRRVGSSIGGSGYKDKKRPRLIMSDSGSSDESLEGMKRKSSEKFHNGGVGCRKTGEERECGRNGAFDERKRSRIDLFEFDEYDEFDGQIMRNEYVNDRLKVVGASGGSRGSMVEKRKHSFLESSSAVLSRGSKGVKYGGNGKFEFDEDEAQLPISLLRLKYQEVPDEPIRFQGKNGVLKVMVNKKKKMDVSRGDYGREEVENKKCSRSEDAIKKESDLRTRCYSESKHMKKRSSFLGKEKNELNVRKPLGKSNMAEDLEVDETDTSLKLAPPYPHTGSSFKGVKKDERRSASEKSTSVRGKEEKRSPMESITPLRGKEENKFPTRSITPVRGREGKVKQGGSTEKQQLREQIREMLIKAGWTIDYRPRRNRDYLDAVYINPNGTAYWSIIKAYDALQKQLKDQLGKNKSDGASSSFAPLSEDLINKLTRQTRKKIEEEIKKKRREDAMSKSAKRTAPKLSVEGSDSDENEETLGSYMRQNRKTLKEKMCDSDNESGDESSDSSSKRSREEDRVEKSSSGGNNNVVQGRKSKIIGRCTLLVRNTDQGENAESDGYIPYTGKRTVLAWLIDSGTVQLSEKVQYMNRRRTRVKLEGWITRDGIHCGCCSKILPVSKFELHAGSKLRQPFQNIFLESGVSLLQCQIDAWKRQGKSEREDFYTIDIDGDDPDDDTCGICGDGGDLICCDSCPSTFHQSCLQIQMLPPGDWHCPNCVCKFCGTSGGNIAEKDNNCCCELMLCSLCERKYHKPCSEEIDISPVNTNTEATNFCAGKCQELYDHLQKLLGIRHELEAGFSWSLIQRTDIDSDVTHRGYASMVESNSKLAVALSIMDECFLPIVDRRSGINLIHNVLYNCGANFNRLNYREFYTAILERGDEIISVASIRIHGTQLAEMPFIGTRHIYRRQGMCRRLLSGIESVLASLKVERLIIPAISEHTHTWTVVFGFNPLEESLKKEMKSINMLVFPGTDMLQKQLRKQYMHEGMKAVESKDTRMQSPAVIEKSDMDSVAEHDRDDCNDDRVCLNKPFDKVDAMDSDSPDSAAPNSISSPHSALDSILRSDTQHCSKEPGLFKATGLILSKQDAESSSSMRPSFPSAGSTRNLGLENAVQYPLIKELMESCTEANTKDANKGPSESSPTDAVKEAIDNQNSEIDECTKQHEPEVGHYSLVDTQSKLCVCLDVASDDGEVITNIASPEVNVKDTELIPRSYLETVQNATEEVNGERDSPSSEPCSVTDPSIRDRSVLDEPTAINREDEPNVPSDPDSNAKAAFDAEAANGEEGYVSAVSEVGDDDTSPVEASINHC